MTGVPAPQEGPSRSRDFFHLLRRPSVRRRFFPGTKPAPAPPHPWRSHEKSRPDRFHLVPSRGGRSHHLARLTAPSVGLRCRHCPVFPVLGLDSLTRSRSSSSAIPLSRAVLYLPRRHVGPGSLFRPPHGKRIPAQHSPPSWRDMRPGAAGPAANLPTPWLHAVWERPVTVPHPARFAPFIQRPQR